MIDLGTSSPRLSRYQSSSRESSFLTSSGLSRARKITSRSSRPCLYDEYKVQTNETYPNHSSGNQSSHVLIVVVLSWGLVFLIIAQRERRIPSLFFFCIKALRKTSTQQPTDLPEPTGPRMPRKKVSSFINAFKTLPSGLYSKLVNLFVFPEPNHTFNNLRPNNRYNFVCLSVSTKFFWVVSKVYFLHHSS